MNISRTVASRLVLLLAVFSLLTGARQRPVRPVIEPPRVAPVDAHSFANGKDVALRHLTLDLTVDFPRRQLRGSATYDIENRTGARELVLDTRGQFIDQVILDGVTVAQFTFGAGDEILGDPLRIQISPTTRRVRVEYVAGAGAEGLHWMGSEQVGADTPYLYTQSEPIDARSWIPIHDSPQLRLTWEATIRVPAEYMAVMSGAGNPRVKSANGVYRFTMADPVPAYLIALAVSDLEFRAIDARSGVYALPGVIAPAASELAVVPAMMTAAEKTMGPYRWERYDVLIMPPAYHIGGMEHPRLTFVSPSFISGDGSLVSLIAHELAHSWSGNLVTTANWDDIWLNEGLTVWLERRIMEAVFGRDYEEMLAANGSSNLRSYIAAVGASSSETVLHGDFRGRDPNEGFSTTAYEKGGSFIRTLEERTSRADVDRFMKTHFSRYAFQWMDAAGFLKSLRKDLVAGRPGLETELKLDEWVFSSGLPSNFRDVVSTRFVAVDRELVGFGSGAAPPSLRTADWTPHEFIYFLRNAPESAMTTKMGELQATFDFDSTQNLSLLYRWSRWVATLKYTPSYSAMERYLMSSASRSGLYSIYSALKDAGEMAVALDIYSRARPRYHPYAQQSIDALLNFSARTAAAPRSLPSAKH